MLVEGQCEGLGSCKAAKKFGYTRQRYYQILEQFKERWGRGAQKPQNRAQKSTTAEPMRSYVRSSGIAFSTPTMSPEVIAQKLNQNGFPIAIRSVERVISEYGLQKKTPSLLSRNRTRKG